MKYRIDILENQEEDVVVSVKQRTELLDRIESLLLESDKSIFGYSEYGVVKLNIEDVYCFFTEGSKVYVLSEEGKFQIRERIYRVENTFSGELLRINQSCLVSVSKIKRFDASISGALTVTLKNGYKDYISRRQLKSVKERIGI